jgi:hypothetical protein
MSLELFQLHPEHSDLPSRIYFYILRYIGMLFYFTAVTSHFPLIHLTNKTFDVQRITCLLL